jgi:hypothetical protein
MNQPATPSAVPVIRCRASSPDLSRFPDVFYLGPQRTGSTWLHANLVRHPQVHLHRNKETFYFSTLGQPQHPRYRFDYLEDYLDSFRESWAEVLLKNYHALRRCGHFYRPRRRADFTASYGVLPEGVIGEIVRLRPDLRGLMLVRDPLDRAWSHVKKDLVRGRAQAAQPAEIRDFFRSPEQMVRADYRGIIERWRRVLRPGHLFVAPYRRLTTDPVGLLNDISGFLGIRQLGAPSRRHATSRQNTTEGLEVPPQLREEAAGLLAQASQACEDLLGEIGEGRIY